MFPMSLDKYDNESELNKIYTKKDHLGRNIYVFYNYNWYSQLTEMSIEEYNKNSHKILQAPNVCEFYAKHFKDDGTVIAGYSMSDLPDGSVTDTLPNGYYFVSYSDDYGYYLIKDDVPVNDRYINLGGDTEYIGKYIDNFYNKRDVYEELKLKHKSGLLLYGPPGTGKTALIMETIRKYAQDKVIIFLDSENFPLSLIKTLNHYPNDYLFIFEEFTELLQDPRNMSRLLTFLDGEYSLEHQLVIGTTNYPEDLPGNMVDRPGRFDELIKIDVPKKEEREKYLSEFIEVTDEILNLTDGFSIAYLRELVLSSKLHGVSFKDQIKKNKNRKKLVEKNFPNKEFDRKIGLGSY